MKSLVAVWRGGRVAEGNGLLNRHRAKSLVAGSNPALSAITWRDRNNQFAGRRAVTRQSPNRSRQLITGKGVAPRHRFEIRMGHNLSRARMAWPVGCGGEYGSSDRRRAEDEPERDWPPCGNVR